jgi:hypothetical protein
MTEQQAIQILEHAGYTQCNIKSGCKFKKPSNVIVVSYGSVWLNGMVVLEETILEALATLCRITEG